jgi:predicted dehydrogenase
MGVVGCGDIAQMMHLPFLTELADLFEVRSVCDVLPQTAEKVAEIFHVPHSCTDYEELVRREDIDAVAVLTNDHAPVVLAAVEAGKHIFVEKPMCYTVEEGKAVRQAVEEKGLTLMVGYMKRYDPGYEYARERIAAMPDIRLVRVHDFIGSQSFIPDDIYTLHRTKGMLNEERAKSQAEIRERIKRALGTEREDLLNAYGLLLGLASHDMTVLRGIFGDPLQVHSAQVYAGGRMIVALLDYPGDMRCVWETGNVPNKSGRWFDEEFTVYGGAQVVSIQFPNPYVRYLPTTVRIRGLEDGASFDSTVTASYDESFRREWLHFHACVTRGETPCTGVQDGLRDLELLEAILRKAVE